MKKNNSFNVSETGNFIQIEKKIIKTKKLCICNWCNHPHLENKMFKCHGEKCDLLLCKNCHTMINGLPFCHECTIDIMKNKTLLIITKGEIGQKKKEED